MNHSFLSVHALNNLISAVKENIAHGDLVLPYVFYVLTNILPVIAGSLLVTYVEPVAAGSGIFKKDILKIFSNLTNLNRQAFHW